MQAAMPVMKLVALLAIATAVALVDHAVSAATTNSSEANEFMPADTLTQLPVSDADDTTQSLQTGELSAVKAAEERMDLQTSVGNAFSRMMKYVTPHLSSDVFEDDVEALTQVLKTIRLEEGAQVSEADRKAVIKFLQSNNLQGVKDLPDEDFSELVRSLLKTDSAGNAILHDSFRTTTVSPIGTFRFDPEASTKTLASDIPLVRPVRKKSMTRKEYFVHQMMTKDGELISLSVPATLKPVDDAHHPFLDDVLLNDIGKIDLEKWLNKGLLPIAAKNLLASRLAHEPLILNHYEKEFIKLFNERDVYIRQKFREWYPCPPDKIDFLLKNVPIVGPAEQYYSQEYKILSMFVDTYKDRTSVYTA